MHKAEALPDELVEGLLVLRVVQSVTRDEPRAAVCRPDRGVEVLAVHAVAVDVNEAEALPDELIERLLVLGVGQPVAGDPTAEGNRDAARELGRSGYVLPAASR